MPDPPTLDINMIRHAVRDRPRMFPLEIVEPSLDSEIAKCGFLPYSASSSVPVGPPTTRSIDSAGVAYQVTEQRERAVWETAEHAYLRDISAESWPGAVIQGDPLTRGDLAVIDLPRAPGNLTIITDILSGTPGKQSVKVADPTAATIGDARRGLLQKLNPSDSPGIYTSKYARLNTLQEAGVVLGLDVHGSKFGITADATFDSSYKTSTVMAVIRQNYYAALFEPETGGAAASAFAASVKRDDLLPFIGPGNPPLMATQVHYGRLVVVIATSSVSSQELKAALKAHWDAAVSGSVSVSGHYKEVVDSADVRVTTIGATASGKPTTLTDPSKDLDQMYRDGLKLSVNNPGAPIAFSARHILGGTLAHVSLAAEYVYPIDAHAESVDVVIPVWDGPGGGMVDTGIDVAHGDRVTISATGQTWSGVWFTGTHGPEGWPGWKAPADAPLPGEASFCLIARYANDKKEHWFPASLYSGKNSTGDTARLQLGINDPNPYNGDPAQKWSVRVQVTRRPAAEAGIFI